MATVPSRDGSRVLGYAICVVLAVGSALFVLALSTWTTLLIGVAVMTMLVLVLTAIRSRQR